MKPATIVGSGTAGTCLAWQFWFRGFPFRLIDSGVTGSSHVAAGLINPVSGKNCTVPEDYALHYAAAETFYQKIDALLGTQVWHPLEIIRLIAQRDDAKLGKKMREGDAAEWVIRKLEESRWTDASAYLLHHGARLDVPHFLSESRSFFQQHGLVETGEINIQKLDDDNLHIWCGGAKGLMDQVPVAWQHRCAKGEILTVHAPAWMQERMITGRNWLVPLGHDHYKIGATYEWTFDHADPSPSGLEFLLRTARDLGGENFSIVKHEAGIRPIVRKSKPVAGLISATCGVFNGLGSKGSLTAPWASAHLAAEIIDGTPIESGLSASAYFASIAR